MSARPSAGGITIRKTLGTDRPDLLSIIGGSGNLTPEERDCSVELLDIYLENPRQADYFFVTAAGLSGRPAGYACYGKRPLTDAVYDLYWILTDQNRRREGIATMLLGHVEVLIRAGGARMLVAETSGLPAYEAARGLYLRNGFSEEARIRDFYKPGDDVVFYTKRLRKHHGDL